MSPAISESFPVSQLWKQGLKKKSLASKSNKDHKKSGEVRIDISAVFNSPRCCLGIFFDEAPRDDHTLDFARAFTDGQEF